jgi:hypothetical protein
LTGARIDRGLRGDGRHVIIAAAGYFAVFKAIELASPAWLAPFYYLQIITAVALGYGMFGDIPDAWTVLGRRHCRGRSHLP